MAEINRSSISRRWLLTPVALAVLALCLPRDGWAERDAALTVGGQSYLLNIDAHDAALETYVLAPVDRKFLGTIELRGRFREANGIVYGLAAGFGNTDAGQPGKRTNVNLNRYAVELGYRFPFELSLGADVGVGFLTYGLTGPLVGGSLTYIGPFVQPRVAYTILKTPIVLRSSAGYYLQFPIGRPHEGGFFRAGDFEMPLVHGLAVGFEFGMGAGFGPPTGEAGVQ